MDTQSRRYYIMGWLHMGPGSNFPAEIEKLFAEYEGRSDEEFFADSRTKMLTLPLGTLKGDVKIYGIRK